ncbi:hypothetical protein ACET3Z_011715 [Daucus carota]
MTTDTCNNIPSMDADRKIANAIGGKTARACDSCVRKRARWYCAADDAFLCQGCDSMVHSANQLASRHERVRLGTASSKPLSEMKAPEVLDPAPAWQSGFTRKARTPRHPKRTQKEKVSNTSTSPLVPEMGNEDYMFEETEAQLLYRVPVFDPFAAEFCNASNESDNMMADYGDDNFIPERESHEVCDLNNLPVLLPSEMELAEFAVDVETLLGTGFNEESCGIEGLGFIDCKEESEYGDCYQENRVKVEDEEVQAAIIACHFDPELDMSKETLDWNFSYEDELEETKLVDKPEMITEEGKEIGEKKQLLLRLNYEGVIVAWDNHGCPWTSGIRPEINPNDCWLDMFRDTSSGQVAYGGSVEGVMGGSDGGREARVSRYREKRRTRLFSKKIRYEVRKLNAEKRPRIKGRFVKRISFAGESTYHT